MRQALLMAAILVTLLPLSYAQSGSVQTMQATLPQGTEGASAVWDGQYAYVFGGWNGTKASDAILRYSPATDKLTPMVAKLPTPRSGTAAAFIDGYAYIFGGHGCPEGRGGFCGSVLRYKPATDAIENISEAVFPHSYSDESAATDGRYVYIFGGTELYGASRSIYRFDSKTNAVTAMRAMFPLGRWELASAFDGTNFYVFGGVDANSKSLSEIWKYEPNADRLTKLETQLPRKAQGASALWDGHGIYVLGGQDYPRELDLISRFNPTDGKITLLSAKLPSARLDSAAIWDGQNAFIFGGLVQDDHLNDKDSKRLNDIIRFTPAVASTEPTKELDSDGKSGLPGPETVPVIVTVVALALLVGRPRRSS